MLETPSAGLRSRLPSLTGMRFLAALLVFVSHIAGYEIFADEGLDRTLSEHLTQLGGVGVSFFFVLSGFVLTWTIRGHDTPARFVRRRLVKIVPNHLATGAVGAVLALLAGTAGVLAMLPSLVLLQAWFPLEDVAFVPNDPAWSLCAELLFYLAFPWLLPRVMRIPAHRLWTAVGVLVAVTALIPLVAQLLPDQPRIDWYAGDLSWWQYWFVYILPVSRVPEFVLGMVLARIVAEGRRPRIGLPVAAALLVPGYALTLALPGVTGLIAPTLLPLSLVICAGAAADVDGGPAPLGGRTLVWLGELSFAFYMVHVLVIQRGPLLAGAEDGRWGVAGGLAMAGLTFVLALGLAWLLFRAVEQPAVRRWSSPRDASRPSSARPGDPTPAELTGTRR